MKPNSISVKFFGNPTLLEIKKVLSKKGYTPFQVEESSDFYVTYHLYEGKIYKVINGLGVYEVVLKKDKIINFSSDSIYMEISKPDIDLKKLKKGKEVSRKRDILTFQKRDGNIIKVYIDNSDNSNIPTTIEIRHSFRDGNIKKHKMVLQDLEDIFGEIGNVIRFHESEIDFKNYSDRNKDLRLQIDLLLLSKLFNDYSGQPKLNIADDEIIRIKDNINLKDLSNGESAENGDFKTDFLTIICLYLNPDMKNLDLINELTERLNLKYPNMSPIYNEIIRKLEKQKGQKTDSFIMINSIIEILVRNKDYTFQNFESIEKVIKDYFRANYNLEQMIRVNPIIEYYYQKTVSKVISDSVSEQRYKNGDWGIVLFQNNKTIQDVGIFTAGATKGKIISNDVLDQEGNTIGKRVTTYYRKTIKGKEIRFQHAVVYPCAVDGNIFDEMVMRDGKVESTKFEFIKPEPGSMSDFQEEFQEKYSKEEFVYSQHGTATDWVEYCNFVTTINRELTNEESGAIDYLAEVSEGMKKKKRQSQMYLVGKENDSFGFDINSKLLKEAYLSNKNKKFELSNDYYTTPTSIQELVPYFAYRMSQADFKKIVRDTMIEIRKKDPITNRGMHSLFVAIGAAYHEKCKDKSAESILRDFAVGLTHDYGHVSLGHNGESGIMRAKIKIAKMLFPGKSDDYYEKEYGFSHAVLGSKLLSSLLADSDEEDLTTVYAIYAALCHTSTRAKPPEEVAEIMEKFSRYIRDEIMLIKDMDKICEHFFDLEDMERNNANFDKNKFVDKIKKTSNSILRNVLQKECINISNEEFEKTFTELFKMDSVDQTLKTIEVFANKDNNYKEYLIYKSILDGIKKEKYAFIDGGEVSRPEEEGKDLIESMFTIKFGNECRINNMRIKAPLTHPVNSKFKLRFPKLAKASIGDKERKMQTALFCIKPPKTEKELKEIFEKIEIGFAALGDDVLFDAYAELANYVKRIGTSGEDFERCGKIVEYFEKLSTYRDFRESTKS